MNVSAPINHQEMLLKLIENDICSSQLIVGLSEILNIEASNYLLRLSDMIFQLLGYDPETVPDRVSDRYFDLVQEAALKTLSTGWANVPEAAKMIYEEMQGVRM